MTATFSLHKICPFFPNQHWHSLTCLTASPTFHFSGGLPSIWLQPEYKISSRSATEENLGWSFFSGSQKCSISAIVNSLTKRKQAHQSQTNTSRLWLQDYSSRIYFISMTVMGFPMYKKRERQREREREEKICMKARFLFFAPKMLFLGICRYPKYWSATLLAQSNVAIPLEMTDHNTVGLSFNTTLYIKYKGSQGMGLS